VDRPAQRHPQVVELRRQPGDVVGVKQLERRAFCLRQEPVAVTHTHRHGLARYFKFLGGVLAHRLVQPVKNLTSLLVRDDQ